ncbi:aconitase X swivel domain-containing protein [Microbacterium sp. GCS4]|uniref:aconitase X swivel domain-containing protein n=1 Tax=Microbacterium sp. GCS4 TaxID=1692239 RepID=UPI0009E270B5|nr:DUF126 domain-containing protein [Microbacterium sp. GCS4]
MIDVLLDGVAIGPLLRLRAPLSFWGGVDESGTVVDLHHPDRGRNLSNSILVMTGRGSSSSSSVLAELIRSGAGPAAIILGSRDAIIVTGALVAAELYKHTVPVLFVSDDEAPFEDGKNVIVDTAHQPALRVLR